MSDANAAQPRRHIPALDGVRGLAITLVLFYHFTMGIAPAGIASKIIVKLGSFGWCGVDLFFVLSGFLITGILDESASQTQAFRKFYARRALRVFPLYFGTLLVVWLVGEPRGFEGVETTSLWNWTFQSNVLVAIRGAWYPLSHFWSLAVEEHFYLFWPFLVVLGGRKIALRAALAMLFISMAARIWLVLNGATLGAYVLTICRFDSLAIGGALSLLIRQADDSKSRLTQSQRLGTITAIGLLGLIAYRRGLAFHDPIVQVIGCPLLALAAAALIAQLALAPTKSKHPIDRVFRHPLPRWLGRYSFGLYVFNSIAILVLDGWQIKAFVLQITGSNLAANLSYIGVGLLFTFGTAWLSWNGLEKHILKFKGPLEPGRFLSLLPSKPIQSNSLALTSPPVRPIF